VTRDALRGLSTIRSVGVATHAGWAGMGPGQREPGRRMAEGCTGPTSRRVTEDAIGGTEGPKAGPWRCRRRSGGTQRNWSACGRPGQWHNAPPPRDPWMKLLPWKRRSVHRTGVAGRSTGIRSGIGIRGGDTVGSDSYLLKIGPETPSLTRLADHDAISSGEREASAGGFRPLPRGPSVAQRAIDRIPLDPMVRLNGRLVVAPVAGDALGGLAPKNSIPVATLAAQGGVADG
jgi:hypothetical protein